MLTQRRAALASIAAIDLSDPSTVSASSLASLRHDLTAYTAAFRRARGFSPSLRLRPMVVVSFLEDELDHTVFSFFSQFSEPSAGDSTDDRALMFVRARYLEPMRPGGEQRMPVAGLGCQVLVFVGHGAARSSSIFATRSSGAREYSRDTLFHLITYFKAQALVLVVCEAADKRTDSLLSSLSRWSSVCYPRLTIFACAAPVHVTEALVGTVGIFLFTVWAFLSGSRGVFGLTAHQQVELVFFECERNPKHAVWTNQQGKPVELHELHALLILAFEVYAKPPKTEAVTFLCASVAPSPVAPADLAGNVEMSDAPTRGPDLTVSILESTQIAAFGSEFFGPRHSRDWRLGLPEPLWRAMETLCKAKHSNASTAQTEAASEDDPFFQMGHAQAVLFKHNQEGKLKGVKLIYTSEEEKKKDDARDDACND